MILSFKRFDRVLTPLDETPNDHLPLSRRRANLHTTYLLYRSIDTLAACNAMSPFGAAASLMMVVILLGTYAGMGAVHRSPDCCETQFDDNKEAFHENTGTACWRPVSRLLLTVDDSVQYGVCCGGH
jgi:hypothetical protein